MWGVLCAQVAGLGSIQFRNWNCSSIPIPILEFELELKLVELKMELELKTQELELKTGIVNFLQLLPEHLLVNQQFPNFSFNRGHNLPCDWLLMQQGLSCNRLEQTITSECSTFHMAPHIYRFSCTRTRLCHGPWYSLVLYLGGTIRDQWAVASAIGTGFYKLLSVFAKLYPPHMPQFYMPTIGNHQNNSKIAPINFNLVRFPLGKPPGFGFIANFSAVDTRVIETRDTQSVPHHNWYDC